MSDDRPDWMGRVELEDEVLHLRAEVKQLRAELGVPPAAIVKLRLRLVLEETFELIAASVHEDYAPFIEELSRGVMTFIDEAQTVPDLVAIADACADIDYVVAGTRLAYGIDGQPVANEVHRSNMAKAPNGVVLRDGNGKVTKPKDWTPPDIAGALGIKR